MGFPIKVNVANVYTLTFHGKPGACGKYLCLWVKGVFSFYVCQDGTVNNDWSEPHLLGSSPMYWYTGGQSTCVFIPGHIICNWKWEYSY